MHKRAQLDCKGQLVCKGNSRQRHATCCESALALTPLWSPRGWRCSLTKNVRAGPAKCILAISAANIITETPCGICCRRPEDKPLGHTCHQKKDKSRCASALVPGVLDAVTPGAKSRGARPGGADALEMVPLLVVVGLVGTPAANSGGIEIAGTTLLMCHSRLVCGILRQPQHSGQSIPRGPQR